MVDLSIAMLVYQRVYVIIAITNMYKPQNYVDIYIYIYIELVYGYYMYVLCGYNKHQ